MTNSTVIFQPRSVSTAQEHVSDFITLCKIELTNVLISDSSYDQNSWNVTSNFVVKCDKSTHWLHFLNWDAKIERNNRLGNLLASPFIDFSKAYLRYQHAASPTSYSNTNKNLQALRLIEAGFRSLGRTPEIWRLNKVVLNQAMKLVQNRKQNYRYEIGRSIERVLKNCRNLKLLASNFMWKCSVKKIASAEWRVGKEFAERRAKKLPSAAAFEGLAYIFRNPKTEADQINSAVCAICCGIPVRANEVLQVSNNCEHHQQVQSRYQDEDLSSQAAEARTAYGLRIAPSKGNVHQIKWVPDVFASVVQEAVERLKTICAEARKVALWYERNPTKLYLPEKLKHLRKREWIFLADVKAIIGLDLLSSTCNWVSKAGIGTRLSNQYGRGAKPKRIIEVQFKEVESAILKLLPEDFPFLNRNKRQRYSNLLNIVLLNSLHKDRATIPCMIESIGYGQFMKWLSGGPNQPSVFERYGFTERDGSRIKIGTHSFRHWLNTIAQMRGVSELDIAKWSGRHPSQNKFYDHETPMEILKSLAEVMDDETKGQGPAFTSCTTFSENRKKPITKKEIMELRFGPVHITDLGVCIHDYSLLPCHLFEECLECVDFVFVKGDLLHRTKISNLLSATLEQLACARTSMDEGTYGADRWVRAHERKVARMELIINIHNDTSISDGTVINLANPSQDSEIQMALRDRK